MPSVQHPNVSSRLDEAEKPSLVDVRTQSESMRRVLALCGRIAESRVHAWISGEAGTGKEWLARAIAASGSRAGGPFVSVDCSAIAEGAFEDKLLPSAQRGILYLRNVEALSGLLQAELLQALCSGENRPAGVEPARAEHVQILVGTRRPPEESLTGTRLRDDLFRRLRGLHVSVPPLRERLEDLPALATELAHKHGNVGGPLFAPDALAALRSHPWPGNVRELEELIQRSLGSAGPEGLGARELQFARPASPAPELSEDGVMSAMRSLARLGLRLDRIELAYVRAILDQVDGNKTRAAATLGIDRKTLYRKLANEEVLFGGPGRS
jgi:DNA-binding NtrC family response regulator